MKELSEPLVTHENPGGGAAVDTSETTEGNDTLTRAVARTIHKLRIRQGISQQDLAQKCSLHRTYLSDVERGSRNISIRNLCRIATSLQVSPSHLLGLAEQECAFTLETEI